MKKLLFFLLIMFCVASVNAADLSVNLKGISNTELGAYEIKELPTINAMRMFEVTYENAQKTVLIYLDERPNCRDYVVRSKNLEVKYVCKKTSFGTQFLSGKQMKYKPELNSLFLNENEFEKQRKISEGNLPIESALGLIASFYPSLLKSSNLLN